MANAQQEDFVRRRITELRLSKNISEHKMSLDLDKSGSYIRGITSGAALPSLKELFKIIAYLDMTLKSFSHHWMMKIPHTEKCVKNYGL